MAETAGRLNKTKPNPSVAFIADKKAFFESNLTKEDILIHFKHIEPINNDIASYDIDRKIEQCEDIVEISAKTLDPNKILFEPQSIEIWESEYQTLSNIINNDYFAWSYANQKQFKQIYRKYYLFLLKGACTLEDFYKGYDGNNKYSNRLKHYKEERKKLQKLLDSISLGHYEKPPTKTLPFMKTIASKTVDGLVYTLTLPAHTSNMRAVVSYLNMARIYWIFCHELLNQLLYFLQTHVELLSKMNNFFHSNIDVNTTLRILNGANPIFYVFSVGFFAFRNAIQLLVSLKHIFYPSPQEKLHANTIGERIFKELKIRHPQGINDNFWQFINLITNYRMISHIGANTAAWITVGALWVDIALICWIWHLERSACRENIARHYEEVKLYPEGSLHKIIALQQIKEEEIKLKVIDQTLFFNLSAAFLLMAGFTASLILTPGSLVIIASLVSVFAVAMYLSIDEYRNYASAQARYEQMYLEYGDPCELLRKIRSKVANDPESEGLRKQLHLLQEAEKSYKAERYEFFYTIIKNTVAPALIIGAWIVCWQAALVLTVLFAAITLYRLYNKNKEVPIEPLPLAGSQSLATDTEPKLLELKMDNLNYVEI